VKNFDETIDALFQGKLKFYQSRRGYRFSLDAILLAYFATVGQNEKIADLGTGNGVIPLILMRRVPSLSILGVEVQDDLTDRARRNVEMNRVQERIQIVQGDVRAIAQIAAPESFDAVLCNPPYRHPGSGRVSPSAEKKIARHEILGALKDFLKAGAYLLRVNGRMSLVYPAVRTVDLLQGMRGAGLEPKRLRLVHSQTDAEASLMLAEGVKGGKSGVKIMAPLVIYEHGKTYSVEVAKMLHG
jgi:tRNA1Val (adenine37-N6)-methyltransferase